MRNKLLKPHRKSSSLQAELHNLRQMSTTRRKEVAKLVRNKEDLVKEKTELKKQASDLDEDLQRINKEPTKSTALVGIGSNTLKLVAPAISDLITYICNLSSKTKSFPEKWKETKVTPIFKKANYRPISV